ncbi:MAG: D-alanyl-D-alanine carboxypeptidase [Lachnospiraceae bacterium]|nr:D-alanyl-D-alanine carboxypeptidase [Lachnospiraceae bacterium]
MIPWLLVLLLLTMVHFYCLKESYDAILNSSGMIVDDFNEKLDSENKQARENQQKYEELLQEEGLGWTRENQEKPPEAPRTSGKDLKLHALSSLLMDGTNNRILYEENGYDRKAMASTTKIMTCIVTLENSKLDEVVTVSSYAAGMPDVQLNIKPGEQYYLRDLLYSLMLESHNDAAVAIAEHVGGTVEGFATMMNDKARELGCEDTNFVTPNGLDAEGHYTTARDLAVIASYAIKNEKFLEITNTPSHSFEEITGKRNFHVSNKNRFLYLMDGAIGVKTGFTNQAGYCFVGAIKKPDRILISVVLGCGWPPNKSLKWSDTKELMNYGLESYSVKQIFRPMKLDPLVVKDGQERWEYLTLEGDMPVLMREDELVDIAYDIPSYLQAPVHKGEIVGYAKYYIDGKLFEKLPIYNTTEIAKIDFHFCIQKLFEMWSLQY